MSSVRGLISVFYIGLMILNVSRFKFGKKKDFKSM